MQRPRRLIPICGHPRRQRMQLADWLARLETLHPNAIALGLERVRRVRDALGLAPAFPLVTVAGTNGKGSTCAYLEAMLAAAGYRVGLYTSPHLLRYNERVRVAAQAAPDADIVESFAAVERARGGIPLTYFEFGTLAAVWHFQRAGVNAGVLEVGLGGRLDAVNVFDADAAILTTVDLDHMEYLGPDREAIGYEKAGVYRAGRPAICADPAPPSSLLRHAAAIGADLRLAGCDYGYGPGADGWRWHGREAAFADLPLPCLAGAYQLHNAAAAIAALLSLPGKLSVPRRAVEQGLRGARLAGRFQRVAEVPEVYLDVAHNPQAARALAANLAGLPPAGRTLAVAGMLADKDREGVLGAVAPAVDAWFLADLDGARGASAQSLGEILRRLVPGARATLHGHPAHAFAGALEATRAGDRILVFGSFRTVAAVLEAHPEWQFS